MSYLHRVTPNKATSQNIEAIYNEKGQMLDANTKEVLVQGQIDKGHKHGYEEQAMRVCAERCHMTQKEYNKMMQNPKLYQFESSHNNRSHKFESKDRMEQLHKCFEVIRDYKGKNRNKAHDKYGKSDFTFSNKSKLQTSVIHRIQLFLIKAKIVTAVMLQLVPSPLYMEPLLQEALVVHCLED